MNSGHQRHSTTQTRQMLAPGRTAPVPVIRPVRVVREPGKFAPHVAWSFGVTSGRARTLEMARAVCSPRESSRNTISKESEWPNNSPTGWSSGYVSEN